MEVGSQNEEVGSYNSSTAKKARLQSMLSALLDDPILFDVPKKPTLEDVDTLINLELGSAMKVTVVKMDDTSLDVAVLNSATLKDLKSAISKKINEIEQAQMGHRLISWRHVWNNFCLSHQNEKLIDDSSLLSDFGIRNNSKVYFIPCVVSRLYRKHSRRRKHRMMKMKMRMVRWETLPSDIIETISDHLPNATDYISFRSVCTSWRAATPKKHNIPFMIVPGLISRNVHNVFRVSDQETRRIIIRQDILGKKCCGASHGYLIMVHPKNRDVVLWNPINSHIIPVPPLITGWRIPNNGQGGFPNPPTRQASMKALNLHKAILTSNPYNYRESDVYLFAIFNRLSKSSKLAYHKVGSDRWMVLVHGSYFKDVIFACDYVCAIDGFWNIFICIIQNETTVIVYKFTTVNPPMNMNFIDHLYLVEVDGQLWAALRYKYLDPQNSEVKKGAFKFAVIRTVSPMKVGIEEVTDLKGRAFFFGLNQSFWMSTEEHTQLKKNCVYYTNFPLKRVDDVYGRQDFGIYDTVKRRIERIPGCPLEYPLTWAPSAWLMPHRNTIQMMKMKMRMVRWENLPLDIIETISDLLPNGTDYISFRSVCTSWRAATPKKHNIPFLIIPGEISRNAHNVFRVS
ncbi:hypothetical protein J5N97_016196 [Dioscorea zingiberensis]|uniref:F-box domain-containing protein n=1 Tax=Dioscorea zingiberensis TaxID=325984 RepID=A0A9D5CJ68_9LILI|nr:hypothetical protein J5N97_016196 [Dioscorea zingiberensis]